MLDRSIPSRRYCRFRRFGGSLPLSTGAGCDREPCLHLGALPGYRSDRMLGRRALPEDRARVGDRAGGGGAPVRPAPRVHPALDGHDAAALRQRLRVLAARADDDVALHRVAPAEPAERTRRDALVGRGWRCHPLVGTGMVTVTGTGTVTVTDGSVLVSVCVTTFVSVCVSTEVTTTVVVLARVRTTVAV